MTAAAIALTIAFLAGTWVAVQIVRADRPRVVKVYRREDFGEPLKPNTVYRIMREVSGPIVIQGSPDMHASVEGVAFIDGAVCPGGSVTTSTLDDEAVQIVREA